MTHSYLTLLILLLGASVAGLFGSLLGVGGGMFIVPMLVLGFHLPMKTAVAASIVSVIATSNAGGSSYVDQRITNVKLAMFLEVFTTAGAIAGSRSPRHDRQNPTSRPKLNRARRSSAFAPARHRPCQRRGNRIGASP